MQITDTHQASAPKVPLRSFLRSYPLSHLLAWLILAAAFARIGTVVFASPMVGYANNFDFLRISACTGVWQTDGKVAVEEPKVWHPINVLLHTGVKMKHACLRSTETLFSKLVTWWHPRGDTVDFREIGGMKLGLLLLAMVATVRAVRSGAIRLALATAFAWAMADAVIIPYFNTFYPESTALPGLFMVLAVTVSLYAVPRPSRMHVVGAVAAFVWLAASKEQYGLFVTAVALSLAWLAIWRWRARGQAALLVACAAFAPFALTVMNKQDRPVVFSIKSANNANAFLSAVLPEARDPDRALEMVRLPASCKAAIGRGWFSPGFQEENPCPAVVNASRRHLLPLFWEDPPTFYRPMLRAILKAPPFYPHHLGNFERAEDKSHPYYVWLARTSPSLRLPLLPTEWYVRGAIALMVAGAALVLLLAVRVAWVRQPLPTFRGLRGTHLDAWLAMVGWGGVTILYAFASSVFGDGYADFEKHTAGLLVGLAFVAGGALMLVAALASAVGARAVRPPLQIAAVSGTQASRIP